MNKTGKNIEDIFKESFQGFKIDPSPGLWKSLSSRLWIKQFLQFGGTTINAYYVGLVIVGAVATYTAVNLSNTNKTNTTTEIDQKLTLQEQNTSNNYSIDKPVPINDQKSLSASEPEQLENENISISDEIISKDLGKKPTNFENELKSPEKTIIKPNISKEKSYTKNIQSPTAKFTSSITEGCQGLVVKFVNTSEKCVWQKWDFGNNQFSYEKNPSNIYNLPGIYTVKLKIKGIDGKYYTSEEEIRIFENPKAMFEIDKFNSDLNSRTIYFNNNSTNNLYNHWDFGDYAQSDEQNPVHIYNNDDIFLVKLKVISQEGCNDSVIIRNNFLKTNYYVAFPSAFTPSLSGPRRGYYTPGGNTDEIFYPDYKGVSEYKLQIFSRTGILIFESTDITYGWNGYYKNGIVDMGVYIWEVNGKYVNGESYAKSGTVTVIHKN